MFISYRRADTGWAANLVGYALRIRLGPDHVFLDNISIEFGEEFADIIEDAVRHCEVFIPLIGSGWDTTPLLVRLHEPGDWVRREIALAKPRHVHCSGACGPRARPERIGSSR